jgi:GMP synthase (glutamine-hydrolysing)
MGLPHRAALERFGTFAEWFLRAYQSLALGVDFTADSCDGVSWEELYSADGVILTGAEEGVYQELTWREHFDPLMRRLIESGKPILGVCFGHQYLADLLGGRAEYSPETREFGRRTVELTSEGIADPLFSGIESPAAFYFSHNDTVTEAPPDSAILAYNDRVPVEAFRWGDNVRAVQFHPEMTAEIARIYIDKLKADDAEKAELHKTINGPHMGLKLFRNFATTCVS